MLARVDGGLRDACVRVGLDGDGPLGVILHYIFKDLFGREQLPFFVVTKEPGAGGLCVCECVCVCV